MVIAIELLNESHIPKAKHLLAGYLNSSASGNTEPAPSPEQLESCEQALKRFLQYDLAHCYLAKLNRDYVGFISLSLGISISKGYPVLRVDGLYTAPNCRNKGVGRKLMQHAVKLATENKAHRLQLETDDDNSAARALYTKLGFEQLAGKGVYMLFL